MGVIDSIMNYHLQTQEAKREREYNKQMWEEQNAYNTPEAQMKRYRDAGLNPNLIYGQGTSGNASSAPGYTRANPTMNIPDPLQMLSQYADLQIKFAQTDLIKAQANTESMRPDLESWKASLTKAQFDDLTRDMIAKDVSWDQVQKVLNGQIGGDRSLRDIGVINRYSAEAATATTKQIQADMQAEMAKWLKANNLSKWIPLFNALFGGMLK